MTVRSPQPNRTDISFSNGNMLLVSYENAVGLYSPKRGLLITTKNYSRTTFGHVRNWRKENFPSEPVIPVDQSILDNILDNIEFMVKI